jgi:hypothetical protein
MATCVRARGRGAGAFSRDGNNALVWSLNMPAAEADALQAPTVAEDEYLAISNNQSNFFLIGEKEELCAI